MKFIILVFSTILLSLFSVDGMALDLRASVADLPPNATFGPNGIPTGPFIEIINSIDEIYKEGSITIDLVPFPRSLKNLEYGLADFHIPIFRSSLVAPKTFPYDYSTANWGKVAFVLYTHKEKPRLDRDKLNQYQIEVMRGQTVFYNFPTIEGDSSEQALLKIERGRIDGYIGAQEVTDAVIIQQRLKNIRRELFVYFDACFLIAKGEKQKQINRIISHAMKKLREEGKLRKITDRIHSGYNDWQPSEYNWQHK